MSTPRGIGSKSTSSASIVENDHPTKSDVHIHRYSEAPDISESDRGERFHQEILSVTWLIFHLRLCFP